MMRLICLTIFAISFSLISGVHVAAAKDDGGFGTTRFSAHAPKALGGEVMSAQTLTPPSDIEPAAGEEDITPESEPLNAVQGADVIHHSDKKEEIYTIQKDLSVR